MVCLVLQAPTRVAVPIRILQIDPVAKISVKESNLSRKVWGSLITGPVEKLDPELERLDHEHQARTFRKQTLSIYPTEPFHGSWNSNGDMQEVQVTVASSTEIETDLAVNWRFSGGPIVSTPIELAKNEEALITAWGTNRKLMLVVGPAKRGG